MSDKCDIDGCEQQGYAVTGLRGDDGEVIAETIVCRKHSGELFSWDNND